MLLLLLQKVCKYLVQKTIKWINKFKNLVNKKKHDSNSDSINVLISFELVHECSYEVSDNH